MATKNQTEIGRVMACIKCDSTRLMSIDAKSSDLNFVEVPHLDVEHDGYAPNIPGVCGGDYVNLTFCLDCGQIQNFKTVDDDKLKEFFGCEDDEDDEDNA